MTLSKTEYEVLKHYYDEEDGWYKKWVDGAEKAAENKYVEQTSMFGTEFYKITDLGRQAKHEYENTHGL